MKTQIFTTTITEGIKGIVSFKYPYSRQTGNSATDALPLRYCCGKGEGILTTDESPMNHIRITYDFLSPLRRLAALLALVLCVGIGEMWGQELIYSCGFEDGTDSWSKSSMGTLEKNTTATYVRTGSASLQCPCSNANGYARKSVTYTKGYYIHAILWAKSTAATSASTKLNGTESGTTSITTSGWTRMTNSINYSSSTGNKNTDVLPKMATGSFYIDDVVIYYSSNSTTDIVAPTAASSASATTSSIGWTCGTDANTGIANTLIWRRTSGSADDLTLNAQGVYAANATDQSGHWTCVSASVAAATTSYTGTFTSGDRYAIVHRDLAYNYSTPTYVTIVAACSNPTINEGTTKTSFAGGSWAQNSGHTITITATGADSYEWYRNTSATDAGATKLSETSNTLDITADVDAGTYYFKAIAKSGACSSSTAWNWSGAMTITEPKMIYLKNSMGWSNAYVTLLGTSSYWDITNGSGSSGKTTYTMSYDSGKKLFYVEVPAASNDTYLAFTKDKQENYGNFYNTEAVYVNGGYTFGSVVWVSTSNTFYKNETKYYGNSDLSGVSQEEYSEDVYLVGSHNSWSKDDAAKFTLSSGTYSKSVNLTAGTLYTFKVIDNAWFGIDNTWLMDTKASMTFSQYQGNCNLMAGISGSYTFTYNRSTHAVTVTYPTITHPASGYVYFYKYSWSNAYTHIWDNSDNALTTWGSDIQLSNYTTICNNNYWYIPVLTSYPNIIVKDNAGDPSNTTDNQSTTSNGGKYMQYSSSWSWNTFSTYTITFAGNSNTGGSMSNVTGLCPNSSTTLAANGYTKTGYNFAGWKTNVAVTANSSSVAANGIVAGGATISNINSNIILTAQWSQIMVTSITLNKTSTTLIVGGSTETLTATVTPATALDKTITWSSSNTGVATVSSSGVVTPVAAGTCTITATAHDGSGKTATCSVTVSAAAVLTALEDGVLYKANGIFSGSIPSSDTYRDGLSDNNKFFFEGSASSSTSMKWKSVTQTINSQSFTAIIYFGGASTLSSKNPTTRAMKFILPSAGKLTIYYWDNNTSAGKIALNKSGDDPTWNSSTKGYSYSVVNDLSAGTYYLYATNGSTAILGVQFDACTATQPTGLAVSDISTTGATFTVTDATDVNNYEFYYSTSSTAPSAGTTATTTSTTKTKEVTGLTSGTTYYAWVRSVCDDTHKSAWKALTGTSFHTAYEVTYKANGGTGADVVVSPATTVAENSFTRAGYDFTGWKTGSSSGTSYAVGATVTSNLTLYAQWSCVTPTITTDLSETVHEVHKGDAAVALTIAATANGNGGNGTVSYQWYSNTSKSTSGATTISGATSATYNAPTSATGTKYYYCIATNSSSGCSTTRQSKYATVKVCETISPTLSYSASPLVGKTASPTLSGNTGSGTVTWTSSNTSVARVNSSGVVTGVATGTVTITASIAENSGYCTGEATASVTVYPDITASISGEWAYIPTETIELTATATGGNGSYTYVWKKGGSVVAGQTTRTLSISNCTISNAGNYTCEVTSVGNTVTTAEHGVKVHQLFVKDVPNTTETNNNFTTITRGSNTVTISQYLENGNHNYQFKINDGIDWWGLNDGNITGSVSNWSFYTGTSNCGLKTDLAGYYTFTWNYSTHQVSVTYPNFNQAAGYTIYFDNSVLNFSQPYYRIGKPSHTNQAVAMTKVPGTDNLWKVTTPDYDSFEAWQICNERGEYGTGKNIYKTDVSSNAITVSSYYQKYAVTADMTLVPTSTHNKGADTGLNTECTFYVSDHPSGMKTDRVTIADYSNGTITVNYVNTSNQASSFTSGYQDLAHTVKLTSITAVPATGYDASAITINGGAYSANYVVTDATTIAASFTLHNYDVTYSAPTNGTYTIKVASGTASSASKTATMGQTVTLAATPNTGYDFTSWTVTKAGGGTVTVTNNQFTMPADDVTITATFTAKTITITFNNQGGSPSSTTESATYGQTLPSLTQPTKTGYQFQGYFSDASGGTKYYDAVGDQATPCIGHETSTFTSNVTLHAQWTFAHYAVTLHPNDGTINAGNITEYVYGTGATLPTDVTRSGYRFDGWFDNSSLTGTAVTTISTTATGNKEFWAKWTAVYTVTYNANGGTVSPASETNSSVTLPTPTRSGYTFQGWYNSGNTLIGAGGATYNPTADITLYAQWKQNCAGGGGAGGGGATLFSQNFDNATAVAYANDGSATSERSYTTSATLGNLVGSGNNLFTSLTTYIKKGDIAINSATGGNSVDASGFFQAYVNGDNTGYWSLVRSADFAATAPTAIKVTMDIWYANLSSGSDQGVQFAIGDGFTDGLKSTSAQNTANVHSGFGILSNSTAKLTSYNSSTAIYATGITQSKWLSITWVINNSGESLTYDNPTGSGKTTLADDKFDIWIKTQAGAASTYTKIVSAQAATTAEKDLQNIYIGYNAKAKKHEFRLDNVVVSDLTPASSGECYYVTYNGNGADGGFTSDPAAHVSGDDVTVLANGYTRSGYSFTGWNTKANGSGTAYAAGGTITGISADVTLYAQWTGGSSFNIIGAVNEDGWGTVSPASINVASGSSISTSSNVLTCNGKTLTATPAAATAEYTYAFNNWTNASGSVTADKTVTANFTRTPNSYTLAWSTNGGSALAGSYTSGTTAFGTSLTKPTTPTKAGYVFGGWSDGEGNTFTESDAMTMPAKNVTYTAVWDAYECTPEVIFSLETKASGSKISLNREGATLDLTTSNYLSTLTGGTATLKNTNTSSGSDNVLATDNNIYQLYFSTNYITLKLVLSKALAEGDVISFESSKTNQISFTTTETRGTTPATSGLTYTIPSGSPLIGATTIYIWRASGSTTAIKNLTITRPCVEGSCVTPNLTVSASNVSMTTAETKYIDVTVNNEAAITAGGGSLTYSWTNSDNTAITLGGVGAKNTSRLTIATPSAAGTYNFKCTVTNTCTGDEERSAEVSCRVVVSAGGCTEIAKVIVKGTTTGTASGSKIDSPGYGVKLENTTAANGGNTGYKLGSNNYVYLTLQDGEQFQNGDVVKVYITKLSDLGSAGSGNRKLHIYVGTTGAGTEIGTVNSPALGLNSVTLSGVPSGTRSLTVHRGSGDNEQNHYIYSVTVERCVDCTPARYTGLDYDEEKTTVEIGQTVTSIAVTGAEGVDSYQWKYSANSDRSSATTIAGATESSYTPSSASRHDTRYYWCELTNECGTVQTSTVAITVTNDLGTPAVSWTGTNNSPNYGGGGYVVKATVTTSSWDGTLTTNMLVASEGVILSDVTVSGKVIQGTYGVTSAATSPITFTLSLPETTNYSSLDDTHEVTFTTCTEGSGSTYNVRVRKTYQHVNNKYYWETAGAGKLTIGNGSNSLGSSKSGTAMESSVFDSIYNSNAQEICLSTYAAGIKTIRVYAQFRDKNITVIGVSKHTGFAGYSASNAVAYSVAYQDGGDDTGNTSDVFKYVDITLEELLDVNDYLTIRFSTGKVRPLGVRLIAQGAVSGSTVNTTLAWATDPGTTVEKAENADVFSYSANITDGTATLSKVAYTSSNTAVATVNSTGAVTISAIEWLESDGEDAYRECTITATLPASGCFKAASLSYTLRVTRISCDDLKGTITVTEADGLDISDNVVTKGECTNVTMTVSGYSEGASIQWYKDGVALSGKTSASITVTAAGVYRAQTTLNCSRKSVNSITINNTPMSVSKIIDEWYIKQGRETPDIALFNVAGATSFTIKNAASGGSDITSIAGAAFEMRDGVIYLKGTAPTGISVAANETIRVVLGNGCSNLDNSGYIVIHKQVATDKPSLAFVVTGKSAGGWTEGIKASETTNVPLYNAISDQFIVTAVNVYAKTDEKLIKQYYSQYDIVCITDYPNTQTKGAGSKSYVNSLGSIVDIRPVLTMEAFVSKLSNWAAKGVSGTPKSPTNRQYNMILQCENHEIFSGTNFEEISTDVFRVNMVDSTLADYSTYDATSKSYKSSDYPALQGFPLTTGDGMLQIGTILNGSEQLQGGIERQVEMSARMMVLGVNSKAMERLSTDGQTVIINALNYLMKKNEEDIADCSNYFLGTTNSNWDIAANWLYKRLPTEKEEARILAPCVLSTDAKVASIKIVPAGTSKHKSGTCDGSLTIAINGRLTVTGDSKQATAPRYKVTSPLQPQDLTINSNSNSIGAFIYADELGTTGATVNFYARGSNGGKAGTTWQYMGVPFTDMEHAQYYFYNAWMCRWTANDHTYNEATSQWQYIGSYDPLYPFEGYALSQSSAKTYNIQGTLSAATGKDIVLNSGGTVYTGYNLIANSWMAPIQITQMENADFGSATKTIFIYNTGTYDQWSSGGNDVTLSDQRETNTAGQYISIPINAAASMGDQYKTIPPLQAFFIKTGSAATLKLDYDKIVRTTNAKTNNGLRAPRRDNADNENSILHTKIALESETTGDIVHILTGSDEFTNGFDDGWDGEKMEADSNLPLLAVAGQDNDYAVSSQPELEGTILNFHASKNDDIYDIIITTRETGLELYDMITNVSVPLTDTTAYTFNSTNCTTHKRFIIRRKPNIATEIPSNDGSYLNAYAVGNKICLSNNTELTTSADVFDATGKLIQSLVLKPHDQIIVATPAAQGVYMIRLTNAEQAQTIKVML